jgi:hypothetical protein
VLFAHPCALWSVLPLLQAMCMCIAIQLCAHVSGFMSALCSRLCAPGPGSMPHAPCSGYLLCFSPQAHAHGPMLWALKSHNAPCVPGLFSSLSAFSLRLHALYIPWPCPQVCLFPGSRSVPPMLPVSQAQAPWYVLVCVSRLLRPSSPCAPGLRICAVCSQALCSRLQALCSVFQAPSSGSCLCCSCSGFQAPGSQSCVLCSCALCPVLSGSRFCAPALSPRILGSRLCSCALCLCSVSVLHVLSVSKLCLCALCSRLCMLNFTNHTLTHHTTRHKTCNRQHATFNMQHNM